MSGMTWLTRTISWHRRTIAAVLTALGMLALLSHLSGADTLSEDVVVASADVKPGDVLTRSDISLQTMPSALVPAGALRSPDEVVGRSAAVALSERSVVQAALLVAVAPPTSGRSLVPIMVGDQHLRDMLTPGLTVALVSSVGEAPGVLTEDAVVHATPPAADTSLVGAAQSTLVLVDVPSHLAPEVSVLGQSGQLSVFLAS